MAVGAAVRRDQHVAVAVRHVREGDGPVLPRLPASRGEQEVPEAARGVPDAAARPPIDPGVDLSGAAPEAALADELQKAADGDSLPCPGDDRYAHARVLLGFAQHLA
jgi:hypothetical protein